MRKMDFPQGRMARTLWQREEVGISFLFAGTLFGTSPRILIGPKLQERQRAWLVPDRRRKAGETFLIFGSPPAPPLSPAPPPPGGPLQPASPRLSR